jgi:MarR family transcriptional regulator, organic hydroperoxide resistance regulator
MAGRVTKNQIPPRQGDPPPDGYGYHLKILIQLMDRRFQSRLDRFNLTVLQWVVLSCLWQEDGLPTMTLNSRIKQMGGTMTDVLVALERKRFISRRVDRKDRRITRLFLSTKAKKAQEELTMVALKTREETYACLKPEELAEWERLLQELTDHLEGLSS